MKYHKVYEFDHQFPLPIERVWHRASDIDRIAELLGGESYEVNEVKENDKSIIRYCRGYLDKTAFGKIYYVWTERLGEWKAPYFMRMDRAIKRPFKVNVGIEVYLSSVGRNTNMHVKFIFSGDSIIGWLACALGIFKNSSNIHFKYTTNFVYAKQTNYAGEDIKTWDKPSYTKHQLEQVKKKVKDINSKTFGHNLGRKLARIVMHSLAMDIVRLRPLELAKRLKLSDQQVIEACLQGVSSGLLEMHWEILCPQCRIIKSESNDLEDMPNKVHCSSCNIKFGLDFNENVEMTFSPAQWLRQVDVEAYCLLSAQLTPHIIMQMRIFPGQEEIYDYPLKEGSYRCWIVEEKYKLEFNIGSRDKLFPVLELTANGLRILPDKRRRLTLINHSQYPRYILVGNLQYKENALTGQKVTSMQVFRTLCPEQLIRAGDTIGISRLAIMFTDLKGSTEFYYKVGEANAYRIVREHFSFLSNIVHHHHGTVVKTIGDSIMAVFNDAKDSVAASLDIHRFLDDFNKKNNSNIRIKIGLHQENCIAVTMNNMIDYFGTAINTAARLYELSTGYDIIVSGELMKDADVQSLIVGLDKIEVVQKVRNLPELITFYRVTPPPLSS